MCTNKLRQIVMIVTEVIIQFVGLIVFRNSVFFYSSGVSLGLIMSLLMLVYILHRLIPGVRTYSRL